MPRKFFSLLKLRSTTLDPVPAGQRLLVANHDAFGHMIDALDLNYVGAVIPATEDNAEASAAELDELIDQVRAAGAQAVFAETSINPRAAETLADETRIRVYDGENTLYSDSLGAAGTPGETYIGSEIHNITMLLDSWGVTATDAPAGLTD